MPIAYNFFWWSLLQIRRKMSANWSHCPYRRRRKMRIINFFSVLRCALICPEPWICSWPRWWEIGNGSDLIFANFCLHEEASDLKRSHADIRWTQIASMSFHFPQFSLLNQDEIFPKCFLKSLSPLLTEDELFLFLQFFCCYKERLILKTKWGGKTKQTKYISSWWNVKTKKHLSCLLASCTTASVSYD